MLGAVWRGAAWLTLQDIDPCVTLGVHTPWGHRCGCTACIASPLCSSPMVNWSPVAALEQGEHGGLDGAPPLPRGRRTLPGSVDQGAPTPSHSSLPGTQEIEGMRMVVGAPHEPPHLTKGAWLPATRGAGPAQLWERARDRGWAVEARPAATPGLTQKSSHKAGIGPNRNGHVWTPSQPRQTLLTPPLPSPPKYT